MIVSKLKVGIYGSECYMESWTSSSSQFLIAQLGWIYLVADCLASEESAIVI